MNLKCRPSRRAGRGRVGQWLLQPGSCCSRSGGCGGPARAALRLRADALPRSAADPDGVATATAAAVAPVTAGRSAATELSNSFGRGAQAPGRGPGAERLRAPAARRAPSSGRGPPGLDAPTPLPRADGGDG